MVWVFSASYLSMFVLLLWQALRGQSVIRPDTTTTTALIAWAVMSAFAVSLANWRSDSPRVAAVIS
jgi:hypothetical protein